MGEGDARARVARAMSLRERLADVARFVVRPTYAPQPMAWGREAALALVTVFALAIMVAPLVAGLTAALDAQVGFLPEPDIAARSEWRRIIDFLILAPVFEELLFRSWLRGQIAALRFAAYGFAAMGLLLASIILGVDDSELVGLGAVGLVFAGLIHWGLTSHRDTTVPAWFTRHFHWIVWGSTLLFGLIHLGNFTALTHPLGLLVVLPQTIGGLLLAYTRTRLGLGAAIAHHAAFNAVWLIVDYALA
jgi:membrane protease YdiL (CAAX protease family)